ncbi:MAG: HEPN domain-containing protein [bacterium]|nr:HEPN domain-containing protein [bacterium]
MDIKDLESNNYHAIKNFCEEGFDLNQYPKKYKKDFRVSKASFAEYTEKGTDLYFAGRILCRMGVQFFLFLFQQAIELYLKAFLIFKKGSIDFKKFGHHDLRRLLDECIKISTDAEKEVLNSNHIKFVVYKFDPFNEFSRYPESRHRPGEVMLFMPEERAFLDIFIFETRKLLNLPQIKDTKDFGLGFSNSFIIDNPIPLKFFKEKNINFT